MAFSRRPAAQIGKHVYTDQDPDNQKLQTSKILGLPAIVANPHTEGLLPHGAPQLLTLLVSMTFESKKVAYTKLA